MLPPRRAAHLNFNLTAAAPALAALESTPSHREKDPKHVYYLSAEFLMGRTLTNAVHNMGLQGEYGEVRPRAALWAVGWLAV